MEVIRDGSNLPVAGVGLGVGPAEHVSQKGHRVTVARTCTRPTRVVEELAAAVQSQAQVLQFARLGIQRRLVIEPTVLHHVARDDSVDVLNGDTRDIQRNTENKRDEYVDEKEE
jgi:NAD(P)-dependent dehydrogenase (short-subunit alcohol dehydrogenase family)